MAFVKRKQAFIDIKDLKPGDSIGFYRAGGSYFHCGIYDGKGNVIHRGAEPGSGSGAAIDTNSSFAMFGKESNKAEIRKDDLRLVAGSSPVYRINMFDKVYTPRPRLDIVRWAEEQIGKKGYNVFFKNCQHFCTKARYNISFNMQVQEHIILKTEQPYEMNRTLVNIVNLPELLRQPVSYTTAEKNDFSLEGYVGNMSRHMDLDKLSLASSSGAIQQILAAFKNDTHTLFTETTSNCSIIDKGEVIYRVAHDRLCTIVSSDTYSLLIESDAARIRESGGNCANMSGIVFGEIPMWTETGGTYEVLQGLSFDCANSTANSSTLRRADCSNVAENTGQTEFQENFDDEDMRRRNYMLYTFGRARGLVSADTIFGTVIVFCWSWMLYLMTLLFLFLLLIVLLEALFEYKVTTSTFITLFISLLNILSVVLTIITIFVMYQE